jgi:hypothetical protein
LVTLNITAYHGRLTRRFCKLSAHYLIGAEARPANLKVFYGIQRFWLAADAAWVGL